MSSGVRIKIKTLESKKCLCGNPSPRVWIRGRKEKTIFLYEGAKVEMKKLQETIADIFGPFSVFNIETKTDKKISTIYVTIKSSDVSKIKIAKQAIVETNYETLYLYKTGKLRLVFKNKAI